MCSPTYEEGHGYSLHRGHSGALGAVKWCAEDSHLVTLGAQDRCVFQWKVLPDDAVQDGDQAGDSGDDSEVDRDTGMAQDKALSEYSNSAAEVFSAVKPWVNNVVPPSKVPEEVSKQAPAHFSHSFIHSFIHSFH